MKALPILLTTVLLGLLLFLPATAWAKKMNLPLEAMALEADYIVVGEIVAVQARTYQFHVAEYVKGSSRPTVTVQQFEEWTCDVRYAKAAKGQRLVLFLKQHGAALELINGSTGERPIFHNRVTLDTEVYAFRPGQPFVPYAIDLPEFTDGIKRLVRCFAMPAVAEDPYSFTPRTVVQRASADEVRAFRAASKFTGWLYERITTRYTVAKR
jgi:hypothetical protein